MELEGKVAVITGAANGIGEACARRFAAEGARVVLVDREFARAASIAAELGGMALEADVTREAEVAGALAAARQRFGEVDLWFSNAGVPGIPELEAPTSEWTRLWNLHVMSHVWAAQLLKPAWLSRGSGYLLQTASAAGMLMEPGTVGYTVTKHAAVALGEWLAYNLRPHGIGVSCFCPFGVRTRMLLETADQEGPGKALEGAVSAEAAADVVVEGLRSERFLILSHPQAADEWRRRAADHEAWVSNPWPF